MVIFHSYATVYLLKMVKWSLGLGRACQREAMITFSMWFLKRDDNVADIRGHDEVWWILCSANQPIPWTSDLVEVVWPSISKPWACWELWSSGFHGVSVPKSSHCNALLGDAEFVLASCECAVLKPYHRCGSISASSFCLTWFHIDSSTATEALKRRYQRIRDADQDLEDVSVFRLHLFAFKNDSMSTGISGS